MWLLNAQFVLVLLLIMSAGNYAQECDYIADTESHTEDKEAGPSDCRTNYTRVKATNELHIAH